MLVWLSCVAVILVGSQLCVLAMLGRRDLLGLPTPVGLYGDTATVDRVGTAPSDLVEI